MRRHPILMLIAGGIGGLAAGFILPLWGLVILLILVGIHMSIIMGRLRADVKEMRALSDEMERRTREYEGWQSWE
jgi:uncharacterized membrane protein (DUF106 family)